MLANMSNPTDRMMARCELQLAFRSTHTAAGATRQIQRSYDRGVHARRVAIAICTVGLLVGLYSVGPPIYWRLYATYIHPFEDPSVEIPKEDPFADMLKQGGGCGSLQTQPFHLPYRQLGHALPATCSEAQS